MLLQLLLTNCNLSLQIDVRSMKICTSIDLFISFYLTQKKKKKINKIQRCNDKIIYFFSH